MRKLFSNVEKKLKRMAKVIFVLGVILSVIYFAVFVSQVVQYWEYGGAAMVGMFFVSSIMTLILFFSIILSAWCLYGFGEIIEELKESNRLLRRGLGETEEEEAETQE